MMAIKKRKDTEENREFWNFVEQTSKSVEENFPAWKRGDVGQSNLGSNGSGSQNLASKSTSSEPKINFD